MGLLKKLGERLSEAPEVLNADEIRKRCAGVPGVACIADIKPRERARVSGIIESIKVIPHHNASSMLEIDINDGTGHLRGIWYGRKKIPGLHLGQQVIFEGTIGQARSGDLRILSPIYEFLTPEHH